MKTFLASSFLALASASLVFGQSEEPFRSVECRWVGKKAFEEVNKITLPLVRKLGAETETRRTSLARLPDELLASDELQMFLRCLTEHRSGSQE